MRPLYVTSGEPAGIGPDICLSLAYREDERPIVVLADHQLLEQRAEILKQKVELIKYSGQQQPAALGQLYVEHVPLAVDVELVAFKYTKCSLRVGAITSLGFLCNDR